MANKLCLKDYLTCTDDKRLSKTRAKMNKKSHKGRHYGLDHGYAPADGGVGVSEATSGVGGGMNNGVIPGAFTPNVISRLPDGSSNGKQDMRKENRRNAPRKRSFAEFLKWQHRAEEEERDVDFEDEFDDEFGNEIDDFERFEINKRRGGDIEDFMSSARGWDDLDDLDDLFPENEEEYEDDFEDEDDFEFDDLDPEKELDFSDESDYAADENIDDEIDDVAQLTGRFVDFYRDSPEDKYEEEQEATPGPGGFEPGQAVGPGAVSAGGVQTPKIDRARIMFQQLMNNPELSRGDIIQMFIDQLDVTESTAVSYYERLAKEAGLTGGDDEDVAAGRQMGSDDELAGSEIAAEPEMPEMPQEEIDAQPPDRQGVIRQVDNAHLVYKRQMEDGGFEELWVYNIGDKIDDALTIRRAILAGTDIPRGHTRSEDGQQTYTLTTMGNAQLLHITGLSN